MIVSPKLASRVERGVAACSVLKATDDSPPFELGQTIPLSIWKLEENRFTGERERRQVRQCHAKVASIAQAKLSELDDHTSQSAGFKDVDNLTEWWRENIHKRQDSQLWIVWLQLVETRRFLSPHGEHPYASGPVGRTDREAIRGGTPWWSVEPEAVPKEVTDTYAKDASERRSESRRADAKAELARPPEDQLRDALDALRREAPGDAARYESQVAKLAGRMQAKRRRKAA